MLEYAIKGYWGKARPEKEDQPDFHPLVWHSLDVAAVGFILLEDMPLWRKKLFQDLDLPETEAQNLILFLLAIHDLGKFSPHFQCMSPETWSHLRQDEPYPKPKRNLRHDALGLLFCLERVFYGDDLPLDLDDSNSTSLEPLLCAVMGHHGAPARLKDDIVATCFNPKDIEAAHAFVRAMASLFKPSLKGWGLSPGMECRLNKVSYLLAGFTIICDWLGSNQAFFPYQPETCEISDYWEQTKKRAESAIQSVMLKPPGIRKETGMAALFPDFQPSHLQETASSMALGSGPQFFVIEDLTGNGKTEAALVLAHRLMASGEAEGLIFALPTQATADQMYDRMALACDALYSDQATLILGHGARNLSQAFTSSIGCENPAAENTLPEETASAICSAWLADKTKKALLGAVGVCTVDQVMLAVLCGKHQALRLLGLSNKVLVLDEIHAYDAYMRKILSRVVEFHSAFGGSVILLSATLPQQMRAELCAAWKRGQGQRFNEGWETLSPYPLLTHVSQDVLSPVELPLQVAKTRQIKVQLTEAAPYHLIAQDVSQGKCVCWIRNTVDDCLQSYRELCNRPDLDPNKILLLHARFALGDRLRIQNDLLERFGKNGPGSGRPGYIVVATQVLEQSLDIDFDKMYSDLAPIDLLIQRLGRQQRHPRDVNGNRLLQGEDSRGAPVFTVYTPVFQEDPDANWYKNTFERAHHVYPATHVLWLTHKVLQSGSFSLPRDARSLVEAVYNASPEALPEAMADCEAKTYGEELGKKSAALPLLLDLSKGYGNEKAFDEESRVVTRLGLNNKTLRLMVEVNDQLQPLNPELDGLWEWSQVRVSAMRVKDTVQWSKRHRALLEELAEMTPGGNRDVLPILVEPAPGGWRGRAMDSKDREISLFYSKREGLLFEET